MNLPNGEVGRRSCGGKGESIHITESNTQFKVNKQTKHISLKITDNPRQNILGEKMFEMQVFNLACLIILRLRSLLPDTAGSNPRGNQDIFAIFGALMLSIFIYCQ